MRVVVLVLWMAVAGCRCGDVGGGDGGTPDGAAGDGGVVDGGGGGTGWQDPVTLGDATTDESDPRIATDEEGNAIAAWVRELDDPDRTVAGPHVVVTSFDVASGNWATPAVVSTGPDARRPRVAMSPDGAGVVVFLQEGVSATGLSASHLFASSFDGTWSAAEVIGADTGSFEPTVAMASDGTPFALAVEADIVIRRRQAGVWETAGTPLPVGPNQGLWEPQLGADGAGGLIALWRVVDTNSGTRVDASHFAAGIWGAAATVAPTAAGFDAYARIGLAVGGGGEAIATWVRDAGTPTVEASFFKPTGGWAAPSDFGAIDDAPGRDAVPHAAVGGQGNGWVVWPTQVGGLDAELRARRLSNGSWNPEELIVRAATLNVPRISLTTDGSGFLVYGSANLQYGLRARRFTGSFGPEREVGDLAFAFDDPADLSADPSGGAALIYTAPASTPLEGVVRAVRYAR